MNTQKQLQIDPVSSTDRRRGSRRPIDSESTLRGTSLTGGVSVEVCDLSQYGCGIKTSRALKIGEAVQLGLDGAGSVQGRLVSKRGDTYGLEFFKPLDFKALSLAFTGTSVVTLYPDQDWAIPDPEVAPFAPPIKLTILVAGSAIAWGGLILGVTALMR